MRFSIAIATLAATSMAIKLEKRGGQAAALPPNHVLKFEKALQNQKEFDFYRAANEATGKEIGKGMAAREKAALAYIKQKSTAAGL